MKTADQLESLIAKCEHVKLELKTGHDLDAWRQAIIAFTNDYCEVEGGTLIIGVDKEGNVKGVSGDIDVLQQQISGICRDGSTHPAIAPTIYPITLRGQTVIIVDVSPGLTPPYCAKGDCYIRVGSTTRKATFDEMLTLKKRPLFWFLRNHWPSNL